MHISLDTSTAQFPAGLPTQKRIFRLAHGAYAGRFLALFARTPSNLALCWSDPPHTAWTDPVDYLTESDDLPFDAVIDDDGHVTVAYTQSGIAALRVVRLAHLNGAWAPQTPITVYDSASSANRQPSITLDAYNRLWIAWARDDAGAISLRVKSSSDDGATWGAGAADPGTDLSGTVNAVFPRLVPRPTHLHCLYTVNGTEARHRRIALDATLWDPADLLYTGSGLGADITGAVAADGRLGALFAAEGQFFLKEYDGASWGALQTVAAQPAVAPILRYLDLLPYVLFLHNVGVDQNRLYATHRNGATFVAPEPVLSEQPVFTAVFCFDADAPMPFADLTAAAASTSAADIVHPTSGALLDDAGDALYLGAADRFGFLRVILSQSGAGGTVTWAYWNGASWSEFVPASGPYHFDSANAGVRLFSDTLAIPADWQKHTLNGAHQFWLRVLCGSPFAAAPIGTQITAVTELTAVSI
jgi:hypothetical protein